MRFTMRTLHTHEWRLSVVLNSRCWQNTAVYAERLCPDGQAGLSHEVGDRVVKELALWGG